MLGSETSEELPAEWQEAAPCLVSYLKQPNLYHTKAQLAAVASAAATVAAAAATAVPNAPAGWAQVVNINDQLPLYSAGQGGGVPQIAAGGSGRARPQSAGLPRSLSAASASVPPNTANLGGTDSSSQWAVASGKPRARFSTLPAGVPPTTGTSSSGGFMLDGTDGIILNEEEAQSVDPSGLPLTGAAATAIGMGMGMGMGMG
eukprot:CAMPEP_0202921934 /NCGR_PEP_ID=MMETSP1392-20130828/77659_1 /ASSEMBLY_ACC=CAM_ASM_000868 /TAXON_ID=225041 /ORGANISM="Chlamydomonas chlamydogama, Strain SAG 11-48b" /LENGTH=202 /DNA_ID=CAMNT_0049615535 /DNA_START=537 /DNA_END=1141 /DNA_ORIENTATION=-